MQVSSRQLMGYPSYQKNTTKQQVAFSGNFATKILDKCWENHDKVCGALRREGEKGNARHYKACMVTLPKIIEQKFPAFHKFSKTKVGEGVIMVAEAAIGAVVCSYLWVKFY